MTAILFDGGHEFLPMSLVERHHHCHNQYCSHYYDSLRLCKTFRMAVTMQYPPDLLALAV